MAFAVTIFALTTLLVYVATLTLLLGEHVGLAFTGIITALCAVAFYLAGHRRDRQVALPRSLVAGVLTGLALALGSRFYLIDPTSYVSSLVPYGVALILGGVSGRLALGARSGK